MSERGREMLAAASETRCECGQLIAKVRGEGLELKCKRCKRIVVIPFSSIEGWGTVQSPAHL
jgi:phage FluMu protein Com